MVDTSDYDHGNLNSGLCVVQTPTLEGAQAESTIVQSPTLTNQDAEPLTLDVQHDGDETTRVAMRAITNSGMHSSRTTVPQDKLTPTIQLTGLSYYNSGQRHE